jgi:hypothetical protein
MTASPKIWVTFLLDFGHELTGEGKGKVVYIEQEKSLCWLLKAARLSGSFYPDNLQGLRIRNQRLRLVYCNGKQCNASGMMIISLGPFLSINAQ